MILCIDIGNTNAVLGLYNEKCEKSFRTDRITEQNFRNFVFGTCIKKIIISCVNSEIEFEVKEIINLVLKKEPIFIRWDSNLGLKLKLKKPQEIGADLLIGGFAATIKYGVPNIVVDMGTATTVFVVNKNKEFLGGAITAGAILSYKELLAKASKLKNATFLKPTKYIGQDTNEAVGSGVIYGNALMIEGFVNKMKQELGEDDVKVVITGGMANIIYEFLDNSYIHDDNLLLDGLFEASKIL